jgi:hypothetical protein
LRPEDVAEDLGRQRPTDRPRHQGAGGVAEAVGRALAPQVFRHVFRPQPVPDRFTARFPVALSLSGTAKGAIIATSARRPG